LRLRLNRFAGLKVIILDIVGIDGRRRRLQEVTSDTFLSLMLGLSYERLGF
jgi:hypothetical protein